MKSEIQPLESGIQLLESGIQALESKIQLLESEIQPLEYGIHLLWNSRNPESSKALKSELFENIDFGMQYPTHIIGIQPLELGIPHHFKFPYME